MSEKKKGVSWNIKLKDHPSRFSLTAMFAGSAFAILLAALLIVGISALVLVNTGVLSIGEGGLLTFNRFMVLMALVLSVFGIAFSFIFGRLFMKPINTIINMRLIQLLIRVIMKHVNLCTIIFMI